MVDPGREDSALLRILARRGRDDTDRGHDAVETVRTRLYTAKVVRLSLDEPLRPIEVEERYRDLVLVVRSRGRLLGEITLPASRVVPVDVQRAAIVQNLGEQLWKNHFAERFEQATRANAALANSPRPTVSVVVCTRDHPDDLRTCLESLLALGTPADEIIVVDNCPSDDRTRRVCAEFPVRYVLERVPGASRARNRGILEASGELVAFTDDDCVVDPGWLDGLGGVFADPLVMASTGYIGPFELETRAQYLFELHGGFERHSSATVLDGLSRSPASAAGPAGASANAIVRRSAFEEVGLFAEDLGPGTPARGAEDRYAFYRILEAGYRIVFDPSRIVWHRHRREYSRLRKLLFNYALSSFAVNTRLLLTKRDPGALRLFAWWFLHLATDFSRIVRRDERRVPVGLVVAEAAGMLLGPWRLLRSVWSRRRIRPLELAPRPSAEPPVRIHAADPPLSVVLPSYNRREKLREVLAALAEQSYPTDRFETVVVLDGSSDGSSEMVRALDVPYPLKLLEHENRGLAASRNRGAWEATKPVVVFLDDDTVPVSNFLAEHARAHREAADQHLALGYYPPAVKGGNLWGLVLRAWWEDHFRRKTEPHHQWTYIDFCGGNASFPASLFRDFRGFDEDFRGRREDWELAVRLLEGGVRFAYYPAAKALHYFNTSFPTSLRHRRQEARDDVLLASKHPRIKAQLPLAAVALALGAGRSPRALFAYRHPEVSARFAQAALPLVEMYERCNLRGSWRALTRTLTRHAYVLGLADALPSPEDFLSFVAPIWRESVATVPVSLEQPGVLSVPGGVGAIELAVGLADAPAARVLALDPEGQWEWGAVTERVVRKAAKPVREELLANELLTGGALVPDEPAGVVSDAH